MYNLGISNQVKLIRMVDIGRLNKIYYKTDD